MRYLLLSIIIISLVGILMIPNAFAKEVTVQNVRGSSTPGCENTNSCFNPNPVRININDKITWTNPDRASHTVTSGNPTTGPDGYFDSGLMLAGGSYSKTFTSFGTYDYFCMVHPWMEGTVIVSGGTSSPSSTSKTSTFLKLDPLSDTFIAKGPNSQADVTYSGQLMTADKKFYITDAQIKLLFTGFTFEGKDHYKMTTDGDGEYELAVLMPIGVGYGVQAVYDGDKKFEPTKSQTEYFIVTSTTSPSQPSTSSLGAPTFLKLDPLPKTFNTDKGPYSRAIVTFSGQLMTADKKFYITDTQIKLLFTPSIESWNNNSKRSTDDEGKFNIRIAISQGQNYRIQAIFDGNNQLGPSKSLIQSFSVTPSPSPSPSPSQPSTSTSSGGFEWAWILIIVGVVAAGAAGVFVKKGLKKTPKATPQRKTFGVKRPRKRRTVGSPVGASSSTDGPSTYGYFECPNCHEPSAPQGKLRQNPDGSQFCSVCGWKS